MMRSSPTAGSTNRSPVAATVDRGWHGVNSELTQLSTEAERFFARYRYPDWLVTHSRVVGRIAATFVAARRPDAEPIDDEAVGLARDLPGLRRRPPPAGRPRAPKLLAAPAAAGGGPRRRAGAAPGPAG